MNGYQAIVSLRGIYDNLEVVVDAHNELYDKYTELKADHEKLIEYVMKLNDKLENHEKMHWMGG